MPTRSAQLLVANFRVPGPARNALESSLGVRLEDQELDAALAKLQTSLFEEGDKTRSLNTLVADLVRTIARQMKLDLLKTGKGTLGGLRPPGIVGNL